MKHFYLFFTRYIALNQHRFLGWNLIHIKPINLTIWWRWSDWKTDIKRIYFDE
ncbi:hypothetical protein [Lyngbya aestuarii]|uniref:hypothetical protein n=1 Tax=Lyngbya aestuarii TaxID=118322 RepID=UPI00137B205E|nr:hypothetical protein [Lyngbya aestuarii]